MALWENLTKHEGVDKEIYFDHRGFPTIGVGYNLTNTDVLNLEKPIGSGLSFCL